MFDNKVVLVTGGTSGIGLETAKQFAQQGAKVVISGRDHQKGQDIEKQLQEEKLNISFFQSDAACGKSTELLMQNIVKLHGRLDIAFNNAGFGGEISPLHEQTEDNWDNVINANLKGIWLSMKYQIQQFLNQEKSKDYTIVNMSSVWGVGASDFGVSPYVAAKHGVIGLTEAAALEYAKDKIRVNAVCPGWIMTESKEITLQGDNLHKVESHHPVGRLGEMSEVSSAVLWLSTSGAGFVTGHSLIIDGGTSARR